MAPDLRRRDVDTPLTRSLPLPLRGRIPTTATSVAAVPPAADLEPSTAWFVLKDLLGYPSVKNYDGSWTEWGNLIRTPIEKP